jgi:hypothetical protein
MMIDIDELDDKFSIEGEVGFAELEENMAFSLRFKLQLSCVFTIHYVTHVQAALVICGLFICDFAYIRLRIGHFFWY